MRRSSTRYAIVVLVLFVLGVRSVDAWVLVSVSPGWTASVGTLELTGSAGSDFAPTLESEVDVSTVDLESTSDWRVDVSLVGPSWPSTLAISVRASSVKTKGNGTTSAATAYVAVDTTPTRFASGTFGRGRSIRASLGLQYLVEGISAEMGAGTHVATIVYTVTDQ